MGHGIDLVGTITRLIPEKSPPPFGARRLRHVLLVKLSSIGDVVHALPVASALKRAHPGLRLTWAVEDWTAPLVTGHPAIDNVVAFPSFAPRAMTRSGWRDELGAALRALRAELFDVAIDLQGLARSAGLSRAARAGLRIARAGQREGAHVVSFGVPIAGAQHAVEEYLAVAAYLGAATRPVTFGLQPARRALSTVMHAIAGAGARADGTLIVINPSAAQRAKHWPVARWCSVIDALSDAGLVVLIGGAANRQAHAKVVEQCRSDPVDLTGRTTLEEVVALLKHATLHVAPDTGTLHIAAALGTPVVGVYGPTSPARVGPWGQPDAVVHHRELCGRGCPAYCRFNRRCLAAVQASEVVVKAQSVLTTASLS